MLANNLNDFCVKYRKTYTQVARNTGISRGSLYNLSNGRYEIGTLKKIRRYMLKTIWEAKDDKKILHCKAERLLAFIY